MSVGRDYVRIECLNLSIPQQAARHQALGHKDVVAEVEPGAIYDERDGYPMVGF